MQLSKKLQQHKAAVQRIKDLNEAIKNSKYDVVKEMLNDPKVAVNFGFSEVPLPLSVMYALGDPMITKLFLECERIDWLAPTWDRSMRNVREEFGIQYEHDEEAMNQKKKIKSMIDYFYLLNSKFISKCPQEAKLIYERIFAEIAKGVDKSKYKKFLFKSVNCWNAFQAALKYCSNIFVKDSSGKSLLHLTSSITISAFLVSKGLDPNALDDSDWTPFMCRLRCQNFESCVALASLGANTTFVNKYGQSALQPGLSHCPKYLDTFTVTEEMFLGSLTYDKDRCHYHWDTRNIYSIFDFYPQFRAIFESNLPLHLTCIKGGGCLIKYFNMTDQEYVLYLKNIIENDYKYRRDVLYRSFSHIYFDTFEERLSKLIDETKRPLKQAGFDELREHFKNTPVIQDVQTFDTRTVAENELNILTANRNQTIDLIVNKNADYSAECNGLKFFERKEFESFKEQEDAEWLVALYKKGVDLFTPGKASGKSLIGHLNPKGRLKVKFKKESFLFPVVKLSKLFFDAFEHELNVHATIDEDGNCALHYLCSQLVTDAIGKITFEDLKSKKNNAGKSSFDVLIENDKNFAFGRTIKNNYRLEQYMKSFIALRGSALFHKHAAKILLDCLEIGNLSLAAILMQNYDVSLYSIIYCAKKSKLRSLRHIYQDTYSKKDESFAFAIRNGYQATTHEFRTWSQSPFIHTILNLCEEPSQYVIEICGDADTFRSRGFFSHPRFKNCPAPGAKNGCTLLEQHFFSICLNRKQYDFYKGLGVNPRNLIGFGLYAKIDSSDCGVSYYEVFSCLVEDGWTTHDFTKIYVENFESLHNLARSDIDQAFCALIPEILSIYEGRYGKIETCAACNNKIEKFEFTAELECRHIFHFDCIQLRHSSEQSICCICTNQGSENQE